MAVYHDARCRLCRREGVKLMLKGERCLTDKCAVERRGYAPGEHGKGRRTKETNYGLQLREKQKARRIYGVLERQFRNYFHKAERGKGVTGETLLQMLEMRVDNILYRLGLAPSRSAPPRGSRATWSCRWPRCTSRSGSTTPERSARTCPPTSCSAPQRAPCSRSSPGRNHDQCNRCF